MRKFGQILRSEAINELEKMNENGQFLDRKVYTKVLDSLINFDEFFPDYLCPECPQIFPQKNRLVQHFFTNHRKLYAYECNNCEHKTNRKSDLRKHISRFHKTVLPENYDSQILTNKEVIEEFRKFSATVKTTRFYGEYENLFDCEFCEMKSTSKRGLIKHIQRFHRSLIGTN